MSKSRERYNNIVSSQKSNTISARERYNSLMGNENPKEEPQLVVNYGDDVNNDGAVDIRDLVRTKKNQQKAAMDAVFKDMTSNAASRLSINGDPHLSAGKQILKEQEEKKKLLTTIPSAYYNEQIKNATQNEVSANKKNYEKAKSEYDGADKYSFLAKTFNLIGGLPSETYEQSVAKDKLKSEREKYYTSVYNYVVYGNGNYSTPEFPKNDIPTPGDTSAKEVVRWLANGKKGFFSDRKGIIKTPESKKYNFINNDEKKVLFYLYNTEGESAAEEYLNYISPELNRRMTQEHIETAQELAQKNPTIASLGSHITNFGKGAGIGDAITSYYNGEEVDRYSAANQSTYITNAIRTQITNDITEATKNIPGLKQVNKFTSYIGVDNVPAFIYTATTSAIDSAINFALAKGIGSGLGGLSGEALNKATSNVTSILMGSQVAQDSIIDSKEKGLSDSNAITLGIIRGSIEGITEKYSIDSILDNPDSLLSKTIKSPYKRAFVAEGSEEVSSNWLNRIADGLYYADESELKNKYNQYIANGNSKEEALALVIYDIFKEDASSFIAGGLSGMSINVTNDILTRLKGGNVTKIGKSVARNGMENEVINTALSLGEQSEAYQIAKAVTESGEMSTEEIGKIALYTIQELNQQKADTVKNAVYNRVVELGGNNVEADSLSTYFSNMYSGTKSSVELANEVKNSRFTNEILNNDEFLTELQGSINEVATKQNGIYSAISRKSPTTPKTSDSAEESKNKAIGFTEPTDKEIYREPTTEEMSEAVFGKRKNAKQRHILDVANKLDKDLKVVYAPRSSNILNGKNGKYNPDTKTMYLAEDLTTVEGYAEVFKHEFVHRLELRKAYDSFKKYLFNKSEAFELYAKSRLYILDGEKTVERTREEAISALIDMYITNFKGDDKIPQKIRDNFTREKAEREAVADFVARVLFKGNTSDLRMALNDSQLREVVGMETDLSLFEQMAKDDRGLLKKIIDVIKDFIRNIKGVPQFKSLEQDLKYIEERLTRVYNSADNKKTATESGEIYNETSFSNDHYWYPQMSKSDLQRVKNIAKYEVNNDKNYIDNETKWLYNDRGQKVYFALYSTAHIDNPTILYACNNNRAINEHLILKDILEEVVDNGEDFNETTSFVEQILISIENWSSGQATHTVNTLGGKSNGGNVAPNSQNKRAKPSEAFIDCIKNRRKISNTRRRGNVSYSSDDIPDQTRKLIDSYTNGEISQGEFLNKANELWIEANEKFGSLPQGENAKNSIQVPEAVSNDKPTERFIRTIIETDTLKENALKNISEKVLLGDFSYEVISDDSAIKKADNAVKNGTAESAWENTIEHSVKIGKNQIAIGEKLLTKAIKEHDVFAIMKLSSELSDVLTRAGQTVQAARLLKKMSGPGRLVALQRTVKTLNNDLQKKYGIDRTPIRISEETAQRIVNAKTPNGLEYAYQEAMQEIAYQIPATWLDKWNAWRYFAMLCNPKTHIRNIFGNGIFTPFVRIKNFLATGIESSSAALGIIDKDSKTKSILIKKEYAEFAKNDSKNNAVKQLLKGNKYNDKTALKEKQRIFKIQALEFITQFNSNALEAEDMLFKNKHYIHALAGYLQARNVNIKNASEDVLTEARIYAVNEAKKATFNDESAIADWIQKFGNKNLATNIMVEGLLPFKRTPINIVKRGIEYSPLGLTSTLTKGIYDVKKGKITATEFIDGLASGLTGTGIMLVGMLLANLGCVSGGNEDDELSAFEKWLGKQEYAIEFLGKSYTIDWAAPACIPFFIGVEIIGSIENGEALQFSDFGNALWNSLEPITNLSMLSGIQSTIAATRYADNNQIFSAILGDVISSYTMQGIPSLSGAVSRTIDPTQRTWYTDKNSKWFDSFSQSIINNVQSKVPGLSYTQVPKIDAWGREVKRGGIGERLIENFVSPGYYSEIEYSETNEELKRLFVKTGEKTLPKTADKSFSVNGETKYLTADEYVKYAKAKGEYSFAYVHEFIDSSKYERLTDNEKAEVIIKLYRFANAKAKAEVSDYDLMGKNSDFKTVTMLEKNGKSAIDYYISRAISK